MAIVKAAAMLLAILVILPSDPATTNAQWVNNGRCGDGDVAKFNREALAKHNEYRKLHQSKPLTTSNKLVQYAQEYANRLAEKDPRKLEHDVGRLNDLHVGENLFRKWDGSDINGASAVVDWYNELPRYNFKSPETSENTGHFTQVLWASSTEVGCAAAKSKKEPDRKCYVVCNYTPGGNVEGQYTANVKRPVKS